jgi:glutamate racemase
MNPSPIGVFDSGVGGLTVVRALNRLLPSESVLYFGDTARLPYGSKSPETVIRFSIEDAAFLTGKNVKMVVVACNTASSVSLPALRDALDIPVVGVILPGAEMASARTVNGRVGVIGTHGTIASGAYQRALFELGVKSVSAQPSPLLVPLVEEGWLDHPITEAIIREYTTPLVLEGIDTLVLGCTHYPLLKTLFTKVLGEGVTLVDSAEATALKVGGIIGENGIARTGGRGRNSFYVSDIPLKFQEIAQRFLGRSVSLVTQIQVGEHAG